MDPRHNAGRPLAGLAIVFLLAGCAAGANPTATPTTPAPAATPAVATTPAAATTPSGTPGRTLVSGSMSCGFSGPDAGPPPAPTPALLTPDDEIFDITCTHTMSDPRVTGTERYVYVPRGADFPEVDGGTALWSDVPLVLEAEGGTWEGRAVGADYMAHGRLYTLGANVYRGQGAFAGLSYTVMFFRDRWQGSTYLLSGWIEPVE